MEFEYDAEKSAANREKHGIDFEDAQALWDDPQAVEGRAKSVDEEERLMAVGKIGGRYWAAIFTLRGAVRRLISVRRAREKEVEAYESQ